MGAKVSFDPVNKIINVTQAPALIGGEQVVELNVKIDLYSDGKEDWITDASLQKLDFPLRAVGGDPLPGSKSLGSTFFIAPPWRIRPYEASHILRVNGNMYMEDGTSPFTQTLGTYNVMVESTVSNLVDSTVAQLKEIEYSSFQNHVWIDAVNGYSGTEYPIGTREHPVNNVTDAVAIATERGFGMLGLLGDLTLSTGDSVENFKLEGFNPIQTNLVIEAGSDTHNCEMRNCTVSGTLDGGNFITDCVVTDLYYVNGYIQHSIIEGIIQLGGNARATINDCVCSSSNTTMTLDMGGSGQTLMMRDYHGVLALTNLSAPDLVYITVSAGEIILDSTISDGILRIDGIGKVTDNATGYTSLETGALVGPPSIAEGVWAYER